MDANIRDALETAVDRMRDEIIDTLQRLVRIPSITGNEGKAQEFVHCLYETAGLEVLALEAEYNKIKNHPGFCNSEKPFKDRPNIIGTLQGHPDKKSIILNGHVDVVSPEPVESWKHDPWGGEIVDNRLYGRGACDMKAGLVANLYALKALMKNGLKSLGTIMLQSVIEEEDGGGGGALACFRIGDVVDKHDKPLIDIHSQKTDSRLGGFGVCTSAISKISSGNMR